MHVRRWFIWILAAALIASTTASAQVSFVAFESGSVRPLALSPDGSRLFAVNTPDNRLEVFDVLGGELAAGGLDSGRDGAGCSSRPHE